MPGKSPTSLRPLSDRQPAKKGNIVSGVETMASHSRRIFWRELPGGGVVSIDVMAGHSPLGRRRFDGSVIVERRSHPRRSDGAPVIARASGRSVEDVVQQLLPLALCNSRIGAAMLERAWR